MEVFDIFRVKGTTIIKMYFLLVVTMLSLGMTQVTASIVDDIRNPAIKSFFMEGDYDGAMPPTDGVTTVKMGLYVNHLILDEEKQELSINYLLRQGWEDSRLNNLTRSYWGNEKLHITSPASKLLWKPDTYVRNALEVKIIKEPTQQFLMSVDGQGSVLFVQTIDLKSSCNSESDTPVVSCVLKFGSFGFTDLVNYTWFDDAVTLDGQMAMDDLVIDKPQDSDCTMKNSSAPHTCLQVKFQFTRNFVRPIPGGLFALTFITVMASWAGFWIDGDAVFKRCMLSLMCVLILVLCSLPSMAPNGLRHSKGLQVWNTFCTTLTALTLLEYLLVHILLRIIPKRIKSIKTVEKTFEFENTTMDKVSLTADAVSGLFIFPVIFGLFLVYFWGSSNYM